LFTLYFPREEGMIKDQENKKIENKGKPAQTAFNILIVDDEVALTELNAEVLRSEGHNIKTAFNANEALELVNENDFDVIISDVVMPGLNGFELADKVKARHPEIKIIMVSGYNDQFDSEEKSSHSYDVQLEKPVSRAQLIESINSVLSKE
jgi:CheY-like chemotaxis protein